jgi:hypothetical protein
MALTAAQKFPPLDEATVKTWPAEMVTDYNRRRDAAIASEIADPPGPSFEETRKELTTLIEKLPERVEVPFEKTAAGARNARFNSALTGVADEFLRPLDRRLLRSPVSFDRIANWNGHFPGPIATGATGTRKTGAGFAAVQRLFVYENRAFSFFPVKRLISEYSRYEKKDILDEFYRMLLHYPVLLVDDLDKINWQFESEVSILFQFYDWVYRARRAVITTTNQNRAWWTERTGPAFVRRIFDEAHFEVKF